MPGIALKTWALKAQAARRRSARTRERPGRGIPTSKQGKLARKKAAAEGSRKERRGREGWRNLNYRLDFGAREPPRATALSALAERRSCGWRCLLRRRTSLRGKKPNRCSPMRQVYRIVRKGTRSCAVNTVARAGAPCEAWVYRSTDTESLITGCLCRKGLKRHLPCRFPPGAVSPTSNRTRPAPPATA